MLLKQNLDYLARVVDENEKSSAVMNSNVCKPSRNDVFAYTGFLKFHPPIPYQCQLVLTDRIVARDSSFRAN
jgi:hypothetical protein